MIYFKLLHLLAALVWVGGMFFAYVVLRPAAVEALQPPQRLNLWDKVFRRFFAWVWGAIGLLFITGFYMVYQSGGMGHAPKFVHAMLTTGLLMTVIYVYVFFACYVPFNLHVAKERWQEAAAMLGRIRQLVAVNLTLGLITIAVAVTRVSWG